MNVRKVVEKIIESCDVPMLIQTCDVLICGEWDSEVTGIISTFMATVDVINEAVAKGANLIITHEPTYYTSKDETDWLIADEVYWLKKNLIENHQINIWRFHDHMHMMKPDLIYSGIDKELQWDDYRTAENQHCYIIPVTTLKELTTYLKDKLDVKVARMIGKEDLKISRVGLLVGGGSLGLGSEQMPMELMQQANLDVIICGEIVEWTLCAYVRDAHQLGMSKSLIILGHNRTEEVGMKHLCDWLQHLFPEIPVWFSEAGEPFNYL